MKTHKTPPAVSSAFDLSFSENDLSENEMLHHSDSSRLLTNDPTQHSRICQLVLFVSVLPVLSQAKCLSQNRDCKYYIKYSAIWIHCILPYASQDPHKAQLYLVKEHNEA